MVVVGGGGGGCGKWTWTARGGGRMRILLVERRRGEGVILRACTGSWMAAGPRKVQAAPVRRLWWWWWQPGGGGFAWRRAVASGRIGKARQVKDPHVSAKHRDRPAVGRRARNVPRLHLTTHPPTSPATQPRPDNPRQPPETSSSPCTNMTGRGGACALCAGEQRP